MTETPEAELSHREAFEPLVGRRVEVGGGYAPGLVLDRIEAGLPAPPPFREPFLLIFRGPKPGPVLPEGLHTVRFEDGPACDLYLMPIHTPWADRQEYQSAFS